MYASHACCRQKAPFSVDNILIAKTLRVTKIAKIRTLLLPLMGIHVAQETTRSQALRLCLGTHWCGGSCLPSSQTKDAFRRGGASLALSYQAEPQGLEAKHIRNCFSTQLAVGR